VSDLPLRLLLVTDSYPPFVGGADADTEAIARAMAARGHVVTVATPWQPGLPLREERDGVEVHRMRPLSTRLPWFARDARRRHHPPFPDPATVLALWRLVRSSHADVVHSYGWITASVAVALIGRQTPLMISARDFGQICPVRTLAYHRGGICSGPGLAKCLACAGRTHAADEAGGSVLGGVMPPVTARQRLKGAAKALVAVAAVHTGMRLLPDRTRRIHSVSTFVTTMYSRWFASRVRSGPAIDTIPPFVRTGPDHEWTNEPAAAGDRDAAQRLPAAPYILFVGSLLPQKGIWTLLDAYRRVSNAPPLVLLGPLHHNSPTTFPPGVTALGATPHAFVLEAWNQAAFGVVPSVGAETFGNVATEAMARGRAVIASDVGGLRDIVVHNRTGLLVPPGDVPALAAAMQTLIDDADLGADMGRAGRERVKMFSEEVLVPRYEALYRAVANGDALPQATGLAA
jgi:glycosyltransferase involved in cell wall biosynthesis